MNEGSFALWQFMQAKVKIVSNPASVFFTLREIAFQQGSAY